MNHRAGLIDALGFDVERWGGWSRDAEMVSWGRVGRFTMKLQNPATSRILYKNGNVGSVETRNTFCKII